MTNNGRNLIFAVLVLSVTAMAHHARAATILIEPDLFVAGSPLTTAFPGVRLSVEGKSHITVISIDGLIAVGPSAGNNLATTGSLVFGQTPAEGPDCCDTGQFWNEDEFGLLRADFETLANTVSIDFYFDDDDVGSLRGYDSLGNLLAFDFASERETSRTMSIHRPENDIAYVLAGGSPGEGLFLDNLQVTNNIPPIPIPAALPLFLSGLGLLGFLGWRRTRAAYTIEH